MTKRFNLLCSLAIVAVLAVTMAFATGCSKKPKEEKKALEPYKIGAIFSVTGRAAPLGQPEKETAELVIDQINKAGGIDGHKLEIVIEDDASDETKAVMAAKKLLEKDKVLAVVVPSISGNTLAIMKFFDEAKTPLISCAASVKIIEPVQQWVFNTPQTDRQAVSKILDYLEKQKIKKIAFISDSNAYGMSGLEEMKNLAPQRGFEIVAQESFGGEDTDMTAQLTRIKGTAAQAIVCWGTNPGPAVVTRNMKQLKMTIPLIQSHGVANMKFIELAQGAADGVILPAGRLIVASELPDSDPQKAVLLEYTKTFKEKYSKDPDTFGGHAYDAIKIVAEALKKSGADKDLLRDEIEKTSGFSGIGGVFNFGPEKHNGLTEDAFVMVKIEGGAWHLLNY